MSSLAAILFDIDDTLCATTAFAGRARRAAVHAMVEAGLPIDEEVVLRELDEVLIEFGSNFDHHYDKLIQRLCPEGLSGINPALVVAAGVVAYHDTKFRELRAFDDVKPLFRDLQSAGVRIGIITHGWTVKQAEKLVRMGLTPYLEPDSIFISDQIGISKPNPKIYRAALRGLELDAAEVMYVGDNLIHDVAPAQSVGMTAVWARRAAKRKLLGTGIEPDHTIESFEELRELLASRFQVALPKKTA